MKKMITVMTMLLLTAMSFGAYQVGDVVENFTFKASTGGEPVDITLYDLIDQGKVVWFDFSETWCVPCQAEAPVLEETWNEFGKEDGPLFICAAITDVNSWDNVNGSSWRTKFDPNLTYWLSTSTELGAYSSDFNGTGYIPYNVLIGPDYKVYYSDSGFNHNGTMAIIKDLLGIIPPTNVEAVVSGSEVSLNWTAPNGGSSGEPEELIFDEGEVHDGYKWVGATMSSRLTPAAAGKILTLKYFITSGTSGFNAEVYDWTGTQPGDMLATYPATGVENDWVEIDVSADNIMFDGDFVVGFGSINDDIFMGFNQENNGRAWDFDGSSWASWNETYFIRAVVQYNGGDVVELGVKNQNFANAYPELKSGKEKSGIYTAQYPLSSTKGDVLYYKIYRNGTYLAQSNTTSYSDLGLDTGTYSYGISAVYDEGESDQAMSNPVFIGGDSVWLGYGIEFVGSALAYDGSTAFDIALDFDLGNDYVSKVLKIKAAGGAGYVNPWKIVEFNGTMTNSLPVISGLEGTIETLGKNGDLYIENEVDVNVDCFIENPFAIVLSVPAMTTQTDENYFSAEINVPNSTHSWIQSTPNGLSWAKLSNYSGLEYIWNLSALVELNGGAVVELLPGSTTLAQNYPNPFNPTTSINFFSNMSGKVELSVYNSNGELVSTLVNGNLNAGNHTVMFDASNLNSGVYFYTLTSPTKTITKKMVLVK